MTISLISLKISTVTTMDNSPSFSDTQDFDDADRGFIASLNPCTIKNARGNTIWNNDAYSFVSTQACPATVNPKLWRQAQLMSKQGLYRISPRIYQVRGFDISHVTFVEGDEGIVVIDPLISCECAAAALKLYQEHRGVRPVKAMIYTHSHIDHFGGAAGILPVTDTGGAPDGVPIIAPEYFMEEAVSENVFAGPVMLQRAGYMYGSSLPRSPTGQMGVGLGMGTSRGTTSLIPPTLYITTTGQKESIDGVEYIFQMVPETEAPAELNIYLPQEKALLIAECAVPAMHNIITLRGALVRDAKAWSRYLDESLSLYCEPEQGAAEVLFASHGWPTWGITQVRRYIEDQRDLYGYMHDQTVKLMNEGFNGTEIAEMIALPPRLSKAWHTQGFYGSVSHNVKGIYQRYMTWFDGRAENLWKWPPREEGVRYVECMGGVGGVLAKAQDFIAQGDLRFAATLLAHVVAAGDLPKGEEEAKVTASAMLADVFEKLGHGAENATWRNFYLSQALELRNGGRPQPGKKFGNPVPFRPGVPVEHWLGALSVRIDGEAAGRETTALQIDLIVKGREEEAWQLILSNGVLTYRRLTVKARATAVVLEKQDLCRVLNSAVSLDNITGGQSGGAKVLGRILSYAGIGLQQQRSSNL